MKFGARKKARLVPGGPPPTVVGILRMDDGTGGGELAGDEDDELELLRFGRKGAAEGGWWFSSWCRTPIRW